MKRVGLAVVVLAAMLGTARAQTVVQEPDKVVYRKVTTLTLTGADIDATCTLPPIIDTWGPPGRAHFASMIKYRKNFNPELQKSQDQL